MILLALSFLHWSSQLQFSVLKTFLFSTSNVSAWPYGFRMNKLQFLRRLLRGKWSLGQDLSILIKTDILLFHWNNLAEKLIWIRFSFLLYQSPSFSLLSFPRTLSCKSSREIVLMLRFKADSVLWDVLTDISGTRNAFRGCCVASFVF